MHAAIQTVRVGWISLPALFCSLKKKIETRELQETKIFLSGCPPDWQEHAGGVGGGGACLSLAP